MIEPATPTRQRMWRRVADELLLLVLAGIPIGVVVVGIGSRVAMLILRLTSDARVDGVESDDGFVIGRFTLGGTYNLLVIGAVVGIIGAAAYQWVRPWLIGPNWFRYATVAMASGAVVGSMLIHADGIDFRALTPTWLAIALFVALPASFAAAVAWTVDRLERPHSVIRRGRGRWWIGAVCVLLFPPTLVLLAISAVVVSLWLAARALWFDADRRAPIAVALTIRALWLGIAVVGLLALVNDIREIAAVT
jgi:hypothetical protein